MKFGSRTLTWSALAAIGIGLLSACADSTAGDAGEAHEGGDVVFAIAGYPTGLDVALLGGRGSTATHQIVDTLTNADPETGDIEPYLARSWEVNDDSSSFTFELRDDVTFSDGSRFDAQIVKDNLDNRAELNAQAATDTLVRSALAHYEGSTVIDEFTVQVDFSTPELGFLRNLSDPYLGFYAESTLAATPEERSAGDLIGTGPFVFGEIKRDESIELLVRSDYDWAPEGTSHHEGRAYLDSVTYQVVPESGIRAGLLTSSQADLVDDVAVTDEAIVTGADATLVAGVTPGLVSGLRQNPYSAFGSDLVVRQALTRSIDREEIRATLLSPDTSELVTSAIGSTSPLYADVSEEFAYDPDGAAELLESDGWRLGDDGVRVRDGERLEIDVIYLVTALTASKIELELIQSQVAEVGIAINLIPQTAAEYTASMLGIAEAGADAAVYDFLSGSGPSKDESFLVGLFKNTNPALGGAEQPELEAAADALAASSDVSERAERAESLQRLLVRDGYWIPIKEITKVVGVASNVGGFRLDAYAAPVFYDTWLNG